MKTTKGGALQGARKGWLQAPPGHPAVPLKDKSGPPSQHSGQGPEGEGFWGLSVSQGTGSLATPAPPHRSWPPDSPALCLQSSPQEVEGRKCQG